MLKRFKIMNPKQESRGGNTKTIQLLLPFFSDYPWLIPSIVILGTLSSLCEGIGLGLFIPFLQSLSRTEIHTTGNRLIDFGNGLFSHVALEYRLPLIGLCIFGSIVLKNALSYSNLILFSWFNGCIEDQLRSKVHQQILDLADEFIELIPSGKLINMLDGETAHTGRSLGILVSLIVCVCTIAVFTLLLLIISWPLTLVVGGFMALISWSVQLVKGRVQKLGKEAAKTRNTLAIKMLENLSGLSVIRSFTRERNEQQRFDANSQNVRNAAFQLKALASVVSPLSEILATALLAAVLVLAGPLLFKDQAVALPTLLTFIFMLYRLQPQVRMLDDYRLSLASLASPIERVVGFLERSDKPYISSGLRPIPNWKEAIRFDHVTFRYGTAEASALQDISFAIPKGKTTALVGPSGAGKSTIAKLIPRFYEVTEGEIYLDNEPLRSYNLTDWRSQIGIVSQDVYVFNTTIRENIAYSRPEANWAQVVVAAQQANAHEFISQLPQGYDTVVGNRGIRLSGGEQQRIAIARAVLLDPKILILDEATSALDPISERLIQEALARLTQNRTVIVIAHRFSTIEQADQIIVLERGRIVEQGSRQYLLDRKGLYTRLHELQVPGLSAD
jgi:ATP-binding cassette, subfamily B, bacterial MsbA